MPWIIIFFLFFAVGIPSEGFSARKIPVIPGAKGFGVETPAGRGGRIIKVTNLNDSGPGSLRSAVAMKGPRTIVFEVGGRIELSSEISISEPFCTIAGQTAPDPGITLVGNTLEIVTHDVLAQHLAVRVGDTGKGKNGRTADAIRIQGEKAYNIVLDHLSASWSIDELVGIGGGARDITISNCILAEPLNRSIHPKGPHGYAVLAGDGTERLALIGNFIAHATERLPRFQGGSFLMANCLIYNKGGRDFIGIGGHKRSTALTCVGNIFCEGPDGKPGYALVVGKYAAPGTRIYLKDNVYARGVLFSWKTNASPLISAPPSGTWPPGFRYVTNVLDPDQGFEARLLAQAGSRPGNRDSVDHRLIQEFRQGKGRIIDSPRQVGGIPDLPSRKWSLVLPMTPHADSDGDGYTDMEEYLHRMGEAVIRPLQL